MSKKKFHEERFDGVQLTYIMDTLKDLGVTDIKFDTKKHSMKFTADAFIELKIDPVKEEGSMSFRMDNAKPVEPKEGIDKTIRCSVDGCNSFAHYRCVEKFVDEKDSDRVLYTMTDYYCDEHNDKESRSGSSAMQWDNI